MEERVSTIARVPRRTLLLITRSYLKASFLSVSYPGAFSAVRLCLAPIRRGRARHFLSFPRNSLIYFFLP